MATIPQIFLPALCKQPIVLTLFFLIGLLNFWMNYTPISGNSLRCQVNQPGLSVSLVLALYLLCQFFTWGRKGSLSVAGRGGGWDDVNFVFLAYTCTESYKPMHLPQMWAGNVHCVGCFSFFPAVLWALLDLWPSNLNTILYLWFMHKSENGAHIKQMSKCTNQGRILFSWEGVCVCVFLKFSRALTYLKLKMTWQV